MVALALWRFVQDPPPLDAAQARGGSVLDVLRIRGLWLILPLLFVNYAPAAGLRGLWVGPYVGQVYGAGLISQATLIMAFAMVIGAFAYGPMDRVFGTRKGVVLVGNLLSGLALLALWWMPGAGYWTSVTLLSLVGILGLSFPLIMAHGRSLSRRICWVGG